MDILNYLPPVFNEIEEVKNICNAISNELETLRALFSKTYDNQFFDTMDADTCTRWENIMLIEYDSTYTLSDRRARIKSRFVEQLPYTKETLRSVLTTLCGEDDFSLEIKNEEYSVNVKLNLISKNSYSDVSKTISRIIPANMFLNVSIQYNTYEYLENYTYEYLEQYTYEQIREEVI